MSATYQKSLATQQQLDNPRNPYGRNSEFYRFQQEQEAKRVEARRSAGVPDNAVVTRVETVEMAGPLQPGQQRPTATRYTYYVPQETRMIRPLNDPFGASLTWYNPKTGEQTQQIGYDPKTNEPVFAKATETGFSGPLSPIENQALLGITAFSVVAAPISVIQIAPKVATLLTAGAIGGPAIAETVKFTTTKQHLTAEEALGAASIGELTVGAAYIGAQQINAKYIQPRVTQSVTASYELQQRANIEALKTGYDPWDVPDTQTWKPTPLQRLAMKVTGAQVNFQMAQGQVAASAYQNSVRFMGNDDAFDFAISPKSSYLGLNKGRLAPRIISSEANRLPLSPVMLTWQEYKNDIATAELNAELKQRKIDQGIPESQLSQNYDPLHFNNYPVKVEYSTGKYVSSAWRGPFQDEPKSNLGMKPLWEGSNVGSVVPKDVNVGKAGASIVLSKGESVSRSGVNFQNTVQAKAYEDYETQFLVYPQKSGLRQPELLQTNLLKTNMAFSTKQDNSLGFRTFANVVAVPGLASALAPIQEQKIRSVLIPSQIEVSNKRQVTSSDFFGLPSKQAFTFENAPGFKFVGGGFSSPSPFRGIGVRSKRRVYPILTGAQVLKI